MSVAFPPSRLPAFPPSRLLNWDFRLFPLMVLTMALAACGGGSGDSQMTSHNDREPIVGNLVASTEDSESQKIVEQSEDDKDSKTEEQQEIIVVNQEEKEPENEEEQQIIVVNVQPESDQESEEEQQQQKIVVNIQPPEESNKEESEEEQQQKIVVNVQPPEESNKEESDDDNNNEEAPQSLTIIEEPEPTYIPPAEEEPKYSASISGTDFATRTTSNNYVGRNYRGVGDINGFSYWFSDNATGQTFTIAQGATGAVRNLDVGGLLENSAFDPTGRGPQTVCDPPSSIIASDCKTVNNYLFPEPDLNSKSRLATVGRNWIQNGITRYGNSEKGERYIIASYRRTNGFSGIYSYKGRSGNLVGDVNLTFKMSRYHEGFESRAKTVPLEDGVSVSIDGTIGNNLIMNGDNFGTIVISGSVDPKTGTFTLGDNPYNSPMPYFAKRVEFRHRWTGGQYLLHENVNSGTTSVVGSFSNDGSAGNSKANLPNHIAGEIRMEGFYQGSDATNSQHNKLVGVFVGDKE